MAAIRWFLIVFCSILVFPCWVNASGFTIYEYGAEQQAQGGAVAAQGNRPSSVFYNPAGIIGLTDTRLQFGTSALFPRLTFNSDATNRETKRNLGPLFPTYLFASYDLSKRLGLGFGFFSTAANKVDYPIDWEGRFFLTKAELRQFNFAPTLAFRISESLAFGVSTVVTYADFEQNNQLDFSALGFPQEGSLTLDGSGLGVYGVAGIRANLGPSLLLGIVYKSPMKITFDGDARFQVPGPLRPQFPDGGIQSALQFPQMAIIGLAVRPTPSLTTEADLQWTNWNTLNSQTVRFDQKSTFVQDTILPLNWKDTWTVRVGGNYQINHCLTFRGGYVYDPSAVPDETISPLFPELDKHMVTAGLGFHKDRWSIDLLYEAIIGEARMVNNSLPGFPQHQGVYKSVAHAAGLSFLYRF